MGVMGKRLSIAQHLTEEEIEQHYRSSVDGVKKSQWQIIWLLKKGKKSEEVAQVTGYSLAWVREIARRYNNRGVEAIGDARHQNRGAKPLLNEVQQAQLMQALEGEAPGGGKWSGPKVAVWMSQLLGRRVRPQRGWEYLKGLEYGLKLPRPAHTQADEIEQKKWKKKLSNVESN